MRVSPVGRAREEGLREAPGWGRPHRLAYGPLAPETPKLEKLCDPDRGTTSLYLTEESDLFNQAAHLYDFSDPKIQNLILCGAGTPPKTETPPPTQSLSLSLEP